MFKKLLLAVLLLAPLSTQAQLNGGASPPLSTPGFLVGEVAFGSITGSYTAAIANSPGYTIRFCTFQNATNVAISVADNSSGSAYVGGIPANSAPFTIYFWSSGLAYTNPVYIKATNGVAPGSGVFYANCVR